MRRTYFEQETATVSAPGKLMLFGDHAVVYGHPSIVTAVDQRLQASVAPQAAETFDVSAPDLGLPSYSKAKSEIGIASPRATAFLEAVYKRFLESFPQEGGIKVTTKSEFRSDFGFGSSSAVSAAFARALAETYHVSLSNKSLFDLCYQAVLDVQGVGSGFDIAAALWGGTLYYIKPATIVYQLPAQHLPIVVGYSGIKADTATLVRMVAQLKEKDPTRIQNIFDEITRITEEAKVGIEKNDWPTVGTLMTQNQALLRQLQVSSTKLDELIQAAIDAGAYGAKLSGAGGGDCMIALTSDEQRTEVERALAMHGAKVLTVTPHAEGARREK